MPRTVIPVVKIRPSSIHEIDWTAGDATNDHVVRNDGNTVILVRVGAGGGSTKVTVVEQPEPRFGRSSVTGTELTLTAGEQAIIPRLDPSGYNIQSGADTGQVYINLDAATGVELAALQF